MSDLFGPFFREKGHPLSSKFRNMMRRISDYAINMDRMIKDLCIDQQELVGNAEEEYKAEEPSAGIERPDLFVPKIPGVEQKSYEQLKQEFDLYSKKLDQKFDELTQEELDRLESLEVDIEIQRSQFKDMIENYPPLLFQSLFIAVYSHFEKYLINLCNAVRKSESLSLKQRDLRGQGIMSSINYLKKVARLNFSDTTEELDIIELLNKIRNTLVHDPEHNFYPKEVGDKIRGYFWIYDDFWDNLFGIEYDEYGVPINSWGEPIGKYGEPILGDDFVVHVNHMFSLGSIQKTINTFVSFSKNIDKAYEEYTNRRKNPQLVKSIKSRGS